MKLKKQQIEKMKKLKNLENKVTSLLSLLQRFFVVVVVVVKKTNCYWPTILKSNVEYAKWWMNVYDIDLDTRYDKKKYQGWNYIYQDRNKQWTKHWFSLRYKVYSETIKPEIVFTKTETNNE